MGPSRENKKVRLYIINCYLTFLTSMAIIGVEIRQSDLKYIHFMICLILKIAILFVPKIIFYVSVSSSRMETDTPPAELNMSAVPGQDMGSLQQELYKCTRRYKEKQSKILLTPREVCFLAFVVIVG